MFESPVARKSGTRTNCEPLLIGNAESDEEFLEARFEFLGGDLCDLVHFERSRDKN